MNFTEFNIPLMENVISQNIKFPSTQDELDIINSYPEMSIAADFLRERDRLFVFGPKKTYIELPFGWHIKFNKNGKVYYGTLDITKTINNIEKIKDWHDLIEFFIIYIISKNHTGANIKSLTNFVYYGKPIDFWTFIRMIEMKEYHRKSGTKIGDPIKTLFTFSKKYNNSVDSGKIIDFLVGDLTKKFISGEISVENFVNYLGALSEYV